MTADMDAIAKPRLRPTRRISIVAGTVVAATAITIIDIGSVAHAGLLVSVEPIIPPRVTNTIEPVAEIIWQMTRTNRLPFFIGKPRPDSKGAFSHIRHGTMRILTSTYNAAK